MFETDHRAQTEPLAALAAVTVLAIGLGIYGAYVTDVLPGASQDTVEEPTIQRVWSEIQEDGKYDSTDNPWNDVGDDDQYDTVENALDDLSESALPRGKNVYIAVTTVNDSFREVTLTEVLYTESAEHVRPGSDEPPEHGAEITRPIAVTVQPGDVRAGTLRVVVW